MKKCNDISYQLIAISLIVIVGIHSLNSFFNTHRHQLASGEIITHAHPYNHASDTDPFKSHQHTATELVFLATLNYFLPVFAFLSLGVVGIRVSSLTQKIHFFSAQYYAYFPPLRGPPLIQ